MKRLSISFLLIVGTLFAQAKYPTSVVTLVDLPTLTNNVSTTLTSPLSATDTTISVVSTAAFTLPIGGSLTLTVDAENILVCGKSSTTFTVCPSGRHYDGSLPASHVVYRIVKEVILSRHINQLQMEIYAIETALGANLSNVARSTHTHPLTGDLAGTTGAGTVVGLRGVSVSSQTPNNGDSLVYNGTTHAWTPSAVSGGSSGASALGYYWVAQSTNAPANGFNLGALSTGLLKITLSGGVATPSTATSGVDYQPPLGFTPENHAYKGVSGGFAGLDSNGLVPVANLPAYPAAQVAADWDAVSGVTQILHKPTVPVNTTGLAEGTNLYYTDTRARLAMAGLYQSPISGAPGTWPSFATIATSGSYADLTNKPTLTSLGGYPLTAAGDFLVGGTSGAATRLAAPGNGIFCPSWTSGVISWITCPGVGSGISSIGLTMPSGFNVDTFPLLVNGTIGVTLSSQAGHALLIAPTTGGVPSWRTLVSSDIPALNYQTPIAGAPGTWPTFATVSTSGNYNDLSNKPTIPSNTSQVTESGNLYFTTLRAQAALSGLYQTPITGSPSIWPNIYGTVASNGTSVTARSTINFISGANMSVGCVDNAGAFRTDCTFISSGGGGGGGTSTATYTGTATFSTIQDGNCGTTSFAAGGLVAGTILIPNWANSPAGTVGGIWATTNTLNVNLCNLSGGPLTPSFSLGASTGGSGSSGAGMAAQLGDFNVTRTAVSVLTVGANCTTSVPCILRFGDKSYPITSPATITISGTVTGAVNIYLTSDGVITVAGTVSGMSLGCSGCLIAATSSTLPMDVLPIYSWTSLVAGYWDLNGGTDARAFISASKIIGHSAGLTQSTTPSTTTLGLDTSVVPMKYFGTADPASVPGNLPGDFYNDTSAHKSYVCNAAAGTAAPACQSVATGQWTQTNGSGFGSSNTFRNNLTNNGGTVDFTPLDATVMNAVEDFLPSKNSNGTIGTLHWGVSTMGATCGSNMVQSQANHPGIYQIVSGTASGDGCSLTLSDNTEGALYPLVNMASGAWSSWDLQAVVMTDTNGISGAKYLVGVSDNQSAYHSSGVNEISVRFDHVGGGCPSNESTTNWVYEVSVAGTKTCVNSGVAVVANTWYHMRMYSTTPGTVQFQINGANSGSVAAAPTASLAPQFLTTTTGGSESLFVDWWAMKIQGLTR